MEQPASERANKTIQGGESSIHHIAKKQTITFIISLVMNEKIKNAINCGRKQAEISFD
jgi:hypothetical protein